MLNEYKRIYKASGNGINTVEVTIDYRKGGMNYWYGNNEPRGYYFSVQGYKVEVSGGFISRSFGIGRGPQGEKACILPCERQSKKRYETAKAMMDDLVAEHLADWCERNGVTIEDNEFKVTESERRS